jgi:hypothetical protein
VVDAESVARIATRPHPTGSQTRQRQAARDLLP